MIISLYKATKYIFIAILCVILQKPQSAFASDDFDLIFQETLFNRDTDAFYRARFFSKEAKLEIDEVNVLPPKQLYKLDVDSTLSVDMTRKAGNTPIYETVIKGKQVSIPLASSREAYGGFLNGDIYIIRASVLEKQSLTSSAAVSVAPSVAAATSNGDKLIYFSLSGQIYKIEKGVIENIGAVHGLVAYASFVSKDWIYLYLQRNEKSAGIVMLFNVNDGKTIVVRKDSPPLKLVEAQAIDTK